MSAPVGSTAPSGEDPTTRIARWRGELVELGGPNTLLWEGVGTSLDLTHAHPGGLAKVLAGLDTRLSELYREAAARGAALTRARAIHTKDRELAREHGVPGCFLAVGMVTWAARRSSDTPAAPVFIRRCRLRPVDARQSDYLLEQVGDLEFNPALQNYLTTVHGLTVPADVLVRMTLRNNGFDATRAYEALDQLGAGVPGWRVERRLSVSTFPYAKLSALTDFGARSDVFAGHPVVGALLSAATSAAPVQVGTPRDPDDLVVLDADPGQLAVIEAVRAGRTVVIDAGPGTGKSQTIVNLIGDLARQGRTALVLAPQLAARTAIAGRLTHIGLTHLVRQVDPAAATPELPPRTPLTRPDAGDHEAEWNRARAELSAHVARMHDPRRPWEVSLDQVQATIAELGRLTPTPRSRVRLRGSVLAAIDRPAMTRWSQTLHDVADRDGWSSEGSDADPWWQAHVRTDSDASRVRAAVAALPEAITRLRAVFDEVFTDVAVPQLTSVRDHLDFVADMEGIREVLDVFRLGIFETAVAPPADGAPVRDRWRWNRQVKALLRPGAPPARLATMVTRAREVAPLWAHVRASEILPGQILGMDRARSAVATVAEQVQVLQDVLARPVGASPLIELPLDELGALLTRLAAAGPRLAVLPVVADDLASARAAGLGELLDDLAARGVPAALVPREVEFVWWTSVLQEVTATDPGYASANGASLRESAARFRESDRARQRQLIRGLADSSSPTAWLLSPHALALSLPADEKFDVVIVDEASSLSTAQVAAALARAPQAVIVGDSHQPLAGPFSAVAGVAPAAPVSGPSLLADASQRFPTYRFATHYRSRDDALIGPANRAAYGGELRTYPAARHTDGFEVVDERSQSRAVARVVGAAIDWAKRWPHDSLAVVTVGAGAAATVAEALAAAVPLENAFFDESRAEPVEVLDAAHATAETRDGVIVLLADSAATALADPGGANLLTAALTRARSRVLVVHAGLSVADPPPSDGHRLLAEVLTPTPPAAPDAAPHVLLVDLARRLQARGLNTTLSGGDDGRIELFFADPFLKDSPQVAVEIDGPGYAAAGGVRARERLRSDQLHRLGWRTARVHSVDLFRDPAREEARIVAIFDALRERQDPGVLPRPAEPKPSADVEPEPETQPVANPETETEPAAEKDAATEPASPETATEPKTQDGPADEVVESQAEPASTPRTNRREQTRDDTDEGWGERRDESEHDRWLEENRPPHWG